MRFLWENLVVNAAPTSSYGSEIENIPATTIHGSGGTTNYYYLKDLANTVLALANSSGSIVESYLYDAYGNVTIRNGSGTMIPASAYGNRFLFQGREYDYTTQLYHFRARWYDPETGRWLSNDPIGISGGLNLYAFCGNDPVNFVDPMGLAIVKNKTSWPIVVSGGLGEGRGHENPTPYYAVVPPGGVGGGKYNPLPAYPTPAEAVAAYSNRAKTPSKPSDNLLYDVDYSHDFACNLKNMNSKPTTSEKLVGNDEFLVYDISVTDCGETDYNIDYLSSSIPVLLYGIEIYGKYTPKSDKFYFHP